MKKRYKILISIFLIIIIGLAAFILFFLKMVKDGLAFDVISVYEPETTVVGSLYTPSIFCGTKPKCKELDIQLEQLYSASNLFSKDSQNTNKICPEGLTCTVFNNGKEKIQTKICNAENICLAREYSAKRDILFICYKHDKDGICACGAVRELDKNCRIIAERACEIWGANGFCKQIGNGYFTTYNKDGKIATHRKCNKWDSNGNCEDSSSYCISWRVEGKCTVYGGEIYNYDDKGRYIGYRNCEHWQTPGLCDKYGDHGLVYTYNKKGEISSVSRCDKWNDNGTCKTYKARMSWGVRDINTREHRICK